LKIWALTDNKPGHQNQTAGLIQALSHYRTVETRWIPALPLSKSLRLLLTGHCSEFCPEQEQQADLIIGAGHKTHGGLLALRRCCGGRAIVLMRPSLPLRFFDVCLIPRHDRPPEKDNVIETLGAINRIVPSTFRKTRQGLVLLGGTSNHFAWDSQAVLLQLKALFRNQADYQWIIASSRRTPGEIHAAIREQFPDTELVLPESVSGDWLPQHIQESEQVWVTEDSISMIYEALTSGAKTGVLQLPGMEGAKKSRVAGEIQRLLAERRVMTLSSVSLDEHETLDEADRCARLILEKFDL
jgi:mitochondrial fission protein ELM1